MKNYEKSNGITLIALIITIVVLIILASVAITLSLGENGVFKKAAKAKEDTLVAQNEEAMQIAETTNSIDGITSSSRDTVTIDKNDYENLLNRLSKLENTVTIDFQTPSTTKNWEKVASYPDGYNYDNSYISIGYVIESNQKFLLNFFWTQDSCCIVLLKSDGIYAFVSQNFTNEQGKIELKKQ